MCKVKYEVGFGFAYKDFEYAIVEFNIMSSHPYTVVFTPTWDVDGSRKNIDYLTEDEIDDMVNNG